MAEFTIYLAKLMIPSSSPPADFGPFAGPKEQAMQDKPKGPGPH